MKPKRTAILAMLGKDAAPEEEYFAEFPVPEGYQPPDEASDGREFEFMGSAKVKPDGTMCVTKIGGIGMNDSAKEEMDEPQQEAMPQSMKGSY